MDTIGNDGDQTKTLQIHPKGLTVIRGEPLEENKEAPTVAILIDKDGPSILVGKDASPRDGTFLEGLFVGLVLFLSSRRPSKDRVGRDRIDFQLMMRLVLSASCVNDETIRWEGSGRAALHEQDPRNKPEKANATKNIKDPSPTNVGAGHHGSRDDEGKDSTEITKGINGSRSTAPFRDRQPLAKQGIDRWITDTYKSR